MKLTQADLKRIEDIEKDIAELMDSFKLIADDPQHYSCIDYINLKSDMEAIDDEVREMRIAQAFQDYKFMKSHERKIRRYIKSVTFADFRIKMWHMFGGTGEINIYKLADYESYKYRNIL